MPRPQGHVRVDERLVGHPVFAAETAGLKGREHPQDLLAPPADAQIVHDLVLHEPLGIDEKEPADRDLLPLLVDAVRRRDRPVQVAGQREVQPAQPAPRPGRRHPPLVQVDGVATDPQDLAMMLLELFESLAHADQLGGADQRKIAGVEQKQQPAAPVILQRHARPRRIGKPRAG